MPHFFTDDNLITTLCSANIQLQQLILPVDWYWILKIKLLNSCWPVVIFWQQVKWDYFYMQSMLVHIERDLGPLINAPSPQSRTCYVNHALNIIFLFIVVNFKSLYTIIDFVDFTHSSTANFWPIENSVMWYKNDILKFS